MLKPFRIRNLLDSSDINGGIQGTEQARNTLYVETGLTPDAKYQRENGRTTCSFSTSEPFCNGIVQVSAAEYDETISRHPQSKLSYMDNDDGELITVGSSLELAQRLEEPVDNLSYTSGVSLLQAKEHEGLSPMHIFDIRRSSSTLDVWRAIEARTMGRFRALEPVTSSFRQASAVNGSSIIGPSDNYKAKDRDIDDRHLAGATSAQSQDDIRDRWFRSCNPPQLPPAPSSVKDEYTTRKLQKPDRSISKEVLAEARIETTTKNGLALGDTTIPSSHSSSSITEEGKRQAQEAGARFRDARNSVMYLFRPPGLISSDQENPRSSYNKIPSQFDAPRASHSEPGSPEWPIQQETQPLLAEFEAEISETVEKQQKSESKVDPEVHEYNVKTDPVSEATQSSTSNAESTPLRSVPNSIEKLQQTMQTLLVGVGHLSSELRARLPEVERRLLNAQQHLPAQVETTVQGALKAVSAQVQVLANAMLDAASSTRAAADRTREADIRAAEQVVDSLRGLAGDVGAMGRRLFSAFEAGYAGEGSGIAAETQANVVPPAAETKLQSEESVVHQRSESPDLGNQSQLKHRRSEHMNSPAEYSAPFIVDSSDEHARKAASTEAKPITGGQVNEGLGHGEFPEVSTLSNKVSGPAFPASTLWEGYTAHIYRSQPGFNGLGPTTSATTTQPPPSAPDGRNHNLEMQSQNAYWQHASHGRYPTSVNANSYQWPQLYSYPMGLNYTTWNYPSRYDMQTSSDSKDTLFIGNLSLDTTEDTVCYALAQKGFLGKVHLPKDSATEKHAGFGYVQFPSADAASGALRALQGSLIDGHIINLEFSHTLGVEVPRTDSHESGTPAENLPIPTQIPVENAPIARSLTQQNRRHRQSWKNLRLPELAAQRSRPSVTFASSEIASTDSANNVRRAKSLGTLRPSLKDKSGSSGAYSLEDLSSVKGRVKRDHNDEDNKNDMGEYEKRSIKRRSTESETRIATALLEQGEADPEFSARYPSLFSSGDRQRTHTSDVEPKHVGASSRALSPESEMARFPSISQLEARTSDGQPARPPIEPTSTNQRTIQSTIPEDSISQSRQPPEQETATATKVGPDHLNCWSGGFSGSQPRAFAARTQNHPEVMRIPAAESRSTLYRSNTSGADPALTLTDPFIPLNARPSGHLDSPLRRSATERRSSRQTPSVSYSASRPAPVERPCRDAYHHESSSEFFPNPPGSFPVESWSDLSTPLVTSDHRQRETRKRGLESKIEVCFGYLKALGFGDEKDRDGSRLRVYAEASKGNLEEAIEMIEEERKAYEQRSSLL